MTSKDITNSVSKFGGILFTPIRSTAEVYYAAGHLNTVFTPSGSNSTQQLDSVILMWG